MLEDALGPIDYAETGEGRAILLVPGSCSTGAAWKPVIARLGGRYRIITTSLPGYGGSVERRTPSDSSIGKVASAIEAVIRHAGGCVHLVGHSFGAEVGLAVALRGNVRLDSLSIFEAPAPGMLAASGRFDRLKDFHALTDSYVADFQAGNREAIAAVIDFYAGPGTFAAWPAKVRAYAVATTRSNILDWASAYAFQPAPEALQAVDLPVLVAVGETSHPAVVEANALIAAAVPRAKFKIIRGASHFMIASHPDDVAQLIDRHISGH